MSDQLGNITPTTQILEVSDKGVANGVASLDAGGKLPMSELPAGIAGGLTWKGTWNASTNTPALSSGVGTNGDTYRISVAGATNLDGITDWQIGDWAMFNGTAWEKMDNTDAVSSVYGRTGAVIAVSGDYNADQITETASNKIMTAAERTKLSGIATAATANAKAIASELNTGTNDVKFATALALEGSKYLGQSGAKVSATASGTNTYAATIAPAITAYAATQRFFIRFTNANTAAATLNLNGLGAKAITKNGTTALQAGDIKAGQIFLLAYDGTQFQILGSTNIAPAKSEGRMYWKENTGTMTLSSGDGWKKFTGMTSVAGTLTNFTHTSPNSLQYTGAATKTFLVTVAASIYYASGGAFLAAVGIMKNALDPADNAQNSMSVYSSDEPIGIIGQVTLATNDTISFAIKKFVGGSTNIASGFGNIHLIEK